MGSIRRVFIHKTPYKSLQRRRNQAKSIKHHKQAREYNAIMVIRRSVSRYIYNTASCYLRFPVSPFCKVNLVIFLKCTDQFTMTKNGKLLF